METSLGDRGWDDNVPSGRAMGTGSDWPSEDWRAHLPMVRKGFRTANREIVWCGQ